MSTGASARTQRTRATIQAAATNLFLQRGFLGTGMDQIAEAATVSKQTVYAHFRSKEELFLDIVSGMTGDAGDELQERVADPTAGRPLEEFLLEFAEQQLAIVVTPRLMQLRRLVIGEAGRFPELGKALHRRGPGRSIDRLARAFERYRAAGLLDTADVRAAGSFFNWLVMGAPVNDAMLLGDDAIPGNSALRGHAQECVRIFLKAFASDPPARQAE